MDRDRRIAWSFLGRVGYRPGVELQESIRDRLRRGEGLEHLLLLEHPPVYTLGRSARRSDIVAIPEWLAARGVEVVECDRGGQVTYHGPGQLVGYPVIDLSPDRRDVRRYVRDLRAVLVRTLADFDVEARGEGDPDRIGVWVGQAKIASIGVHLSRWITTHGFALNVSTELGYFDGIVPCGLAGVRMTSIERITGARPALVEVGERLARHFADVFERPLERRAPDEVWAELAGAPQDDPPRSIASGAEGPPAGWRDAHDQGADR
ncbi:MAG: lipoyl(octanoyl) transferase LipB [Thermoanaerobaculia bacterium]|nr:lipoyl(octanoyl) transferase LipB [Thermoanaerobaculia bacterium]